MREMRMAALESGFKHGVRLPPTTPDFTASHRPDPFGLDGRRETWVAGGRTAATSSAAATDDVAKMADDDDVPVRATLLEPRPFRPFKTGEEYLYAMKEDLADWLTMLYGLQVVADNFLEVLETGVVLCRHANNVRAAALEYYAQPGCCRRPTHPLPDREVTFRSDVVPSTFQARDNVSNFISWCRALGIYDCLLFETDDLVLRKNEKSFILCLLEVARRGSKVGMPAPLLVQLEEEIDREIAEENAARRHATCSVGTSQDDDDLLLRTSSSPPPQIVTNDLKSLDEMVRHLLNRCTCPLQFPMIRVSDGKYRIGDTKVLIYVRILRSHVMVRVGGGWDTLEHYLDKHDPCRCRQGHRTTMSSKLTVKFGATNPAQTQMEVTYQRSPAPWLPAPTRSPSPHPQPQQRRASAHKLCSGSLPSLATTEQQEVPPPAGYSPCDSSSEYSDDGYKSGSRVATVQRAVTPPSNEIASDSPRDSLLGEDEDEEHGGTPQSAALNDKTNQWSDDCSHQGRKSRMGHHLNPDENSRGRRLSGDACRRTTLAPQQRIPRSRSQSNEVGSAFVRHQGGRHSYRTPRLLVFPDESPDDGSSRTWACRPRAPRTSLTPDLFGTRSSSVSPQRWTAPPSHPVRSLQTSPNRHYAPLLRDMLTDANLDSDTKVLRRMEAILLQHRTPTGCSRKRHSSSGTSQDAASPEHLVATAPQRLPVKISPRKDNHPHTGSKIPVPTFY